MRIISRFKSYFLRGLAVLVPTILTIWIFIWGYNFIQSNISVYINWALVWLTMKATGLDWNSQPAKEIWANFWVHGWGQIAGFVIALVIVCIIGWVLASVVGRGLWHWIERLIMNAPLVRRVYPYIKQVTDFLLVQNKKERLFLRPVVVEYPRSGVWTLGWITGAGLHKLADSQKKEFLTVLIPTSPTPFSGFAVMLPKTNAVELDLTFEEALRFIISAGVITPSMKLGDLKEYGPQPAAKYQDGDTK